MEDMEIKEVEEKKNIIKRVMDWLYGGIRMSWIKVILFAVVIAAVTAVFMIFPVFENTSFHNMGVTFEAWFFFAIIIMANCKSPIESALKTFVFFLVSQPLIYLFQVPFAEMGWSLFGYYRYWFIWTLCTLPMAFVGWFITKKNWLSFIIIMPVIVFLTFDYVGAFRFTFRHFPLKSVMAVFCLLQVVIYIYTFMSKPIQRILAIVVSLGICGYVLLFMPAISLNGEHPLPEGVALTENAELTMEDPDLANVSIQRTDITGDFSTVYIHAEKIGETKMTIKDGDKEYHFNLKIFQDDGGNPQVRITEE